MILSELTAISPVDGRYRNKTNNLATYFSEFGLIKYRVWVEVEYFIFLAESEIQGISISLDNKRKEKLRHLYLHFTPEQALEIKNIEKTTNHDVKAVEYFLKAELNKLGLSEYKEWIHFGLTSQDVNNTSIPLSLKQALNEILIPALEGILSQLRSKTLEWEKVSLLARTHGQPASPTRLGKEIQVFTERIEVQLAQLKQIPFSAKFGGATGNFNAHHVAFPEVNWVSKGNDFVNHTLGLHRSQTTTQIEHYDNLAAVFDCLKRINNILIDFSRDIWSYISMDYFKQKIKEGEVGSSAMPHKVNPIDFENAEGNLGVANALFEHLAAKLPISRLQRDLTDSTVLRNIGVPIAHQIIAFASLEKGLGKLILNKETIDRDLENNWAVVAEAIQTVLRAEGYPNPYEALKGLTRTNSKIDADSIHNFINSLEVSNSVKERLLKINPFNYTGL